MRTWTRWVLLSVCLVSSASARAAVPGDAADARVDAGPANLSTTDVVARVAEVAVKEDWKTPGWSDPVIEGWLQHALAVAASRARGRPLPPTIKFADYQGRWAAANQPPPPAPRGGGERTLVAADRLDVAFLSDCVALVDGDVRISHASNCVIVARGAVVVSGGSANVIVAGHLIRQGHDGSERRVARMAGGAAAGGRPVPPASVLVSAGRVVVSHATDTVIAAAADAEVSHAVGCLFLNTPKVTTSHDDGSSEVKVERLRVGPPPKPHPLADRFRLHGAVGRKGAVVWYGDRRYVIDVGKPVTDEAGKPVPDLAGWTVTTVSEGIVVLANRGERATIVLYDTER
ncbi:MAG TPA: hypothetical protein VF796_16750 [Humisphaera sp.]